MNYILSTLIFGLLFLVAFLMYDIHGIMSYQFATAILPLCVFAIVGIKKAVERVIDVIT